MLNSGLCDALVKVQTIDHWFPNTTRMCETWCKL